MSWDCTNSGRSPDEMQWNPGEFRPRPPNPGFRCATSGLRHFGCYVRINSHLRLTGTLFQNFHCGQFFSLEEFQERTAGGGDGGHLVIDAVFLDRGYRVSAASERE